MDQVHPVGPESEHPSRLSPRCHLENDYGNQEGRTLSVQNVVSFLDNVMKSATTQKRECVLSILFFLHIPDRGTSGWSMPMCVSNWPRRMRAGFKILGRVVPAWAMTCKVLKQSISTKSWFRIGSRLPFPPECRKDETMEIGGFVSGGGGGYVV